MGIFANKKFDTKTGEYLGTIEQYQKLAKKKDITLPPSPKEEPKKGLLAKAGSILSSFETAPAVEAAIKGENPFEAYKTSVVKGLSGKEDISTKTSYSNILENAGWSTAPGTGSLKESATWKNFAREFAGLAGDVLLDPTTYLSFGASKGIQLETKAGAKTLSKTGQQVLKQEAKKGAIEIAETLAKKGIQKTAQEFTEAGIKRAERTLAKLADQKLFDQGGIKFAGKTLVKGDTLAKPFTSLKGALSKTSTGAKTLESLDALKTSIGKTFNRDYGLPAQYTAKKQEFLDLFNYDADDIINKMKTVFKHSTPQDREQISLAMETGDLTKLSDFNRNIAEKAQQIFSDIAKEESNRGLLDSTLDDYVTHIYNDKQKAKQLIDYMRGGVRAFKTKFAKERIIPTIEEAEKLGLKPEKDIAKILTTRMLASQKAIREQDLLRNVAGKFGVSKKQLFSKPIKQTSSVLNKIDDPLIQEASKYKSAEEFVKAQSLYHGTSADIQGGKLSFGAGEIRKGGQSGGLFLSDTPESAQVFGKTVYQASPEIKAQVIDLTKPEEIKQIENYIGKTYKTYDGETVKFTRQDFELMFPDGKTDFASISQYPELVDKIVTDTGKRGIAFNEYVGGKIGKTYQILNGDIPIKTKSQLTDIWNKTKEIKPLVGQDKITNIANLLNQDLVEYTAKEFKGLMIPRSVAEDLAKIGKQAINNEEIKTFLRGFDAVQNFFKGSVTSIFPAFHGRNFISNVAQNALDIGVKALNPIFNLKSLNILRNKSKGTFTTKLGKSYSYDQLRLIMKQNGILGSPGYRDVAETVAQKLEKVTPQTLPKQIGRQFTSENILFRGGRAIGTGIENHARALNFLANLERGMSVQQAAQRTKKFLFDYANLSDFEKTIMKRAVPFYTWTRKNIELQGQTLLKRPGVIGVELKAQRLGTQETERERQSLPEWVAEGLAIKTRTKNGLVNYLTGMGLPIENFFVNLPQGINRKEMVDYLNKIASQSAFIPKYLAEFATGHEFFRNKPIKDNYRAAEFANFPQPIKDFLELKENKVDYINKKTGKRVKYTEYIANPYKLHLLRSLPTSRTTSTAGGILDENQTAIGKLLKYTTGIKIYPIDVQRMEEKELKDYIKEIEQILINYGELNKFENVYQPKETKKSIFK